MGLNKARKSTETKVLENMGMLVNKKYGKEVDNVE